MTDDAYERWLTERRAVAPPAILADQVMSQVANLDRRRREVWWLQLIWRIERSKVARWAMCGAALAVGCLPFAFLAYVAQL